VNYINNKKNYILTQYYFTVQILNQDAFTVFETRNKGFSQKLEIFTHMWFQTHLFSFSYHKLSYF